jgi:AcrR family transcriptional regulator
MSDRAEGATRTGEAVPRRRSTPRRRGRPRDPGVDVAIRTATVDLLGEIGYARLTMDEVAARAGVSKASLYLRWPNKVTLVAEALQQRARAVPAIPDTGALTTDMRAFLTTLLRARGAASRALSALSGEIASNPELRAAWRRGVAGALTGCLRTIVSRAVDRGELAPDSDVELLAQLPLALLQTWRQEHDERPDDSVVERIVAQFYPPR